uniref:F-box domain-containing protein n=1 Tax=Caenorhabditis tropicalis TaxID=1561998 RepID=A0A1I7UT89_9PELO
MSFPLLRLPCLALEEIVKNCNHKEILFLVQTSSRARRLISRHTKSHFVKISFVDEIIVPHVQLFYGDQEFFRILIYAEGENFDSSWKFKTLVPVSYDNEEQCLLSCWTKYDQAFQEILDFLNEVFRIEDVSLVNNPKDFYRLVPIAEHVASKNLKIRSVYWSLFSGNEEMENRLLTVTKCATDFKIREMNFFSIRFDHFHLFRMDRLEIDHSSWMTAENVVALRNCKRVRLGSVWFEATDINKILLEYIEDPGELLELRLTSRKDIRLGDVVTGLNAVEVLITGQNGIRFSATMLWEDTIVITRET